jgi:hypothetical protein
MRGNNKVVLFKPKKDEGPKKPKRPKKPKKGEGPKKNDENERKERLAKWRNEQASTVLKIVREDAGLRFLDSDSVDDEEDAALDLHGEYDPVVNSKTGAHLSDAIAEFAEEIKIPERRLRQLYMNTLKEKFDAQKIPLPTDPVGKLYGKYLVNRHGIWTRQNAGAAGLFVWRRIARTRIDHQALSYDTSSQQNWRHHYLITGEIGERPVSIGNEKLGEKANPAIHILMRCGVHVVESKEARAHLAKFLRYKPRARILRAPQVGWFEPRKGHWVFVLPNETLGDVGERYDVVLDAVDALPRQHGFHQAGTSEQWREHVAKPHAHNSAVVLAIGTFLAAPYCALPTSLAVASIFTATRSSARR